MNHTHKWKKFMTIPHLFSKNSTYSKCEICGLLRHDNDNETFFPESDIHTWRRNKKYGDKK